MCPLYTNVLVWVAGAELGTRPYGNRRLDILLLFILPSPAASKSELDIATDYAKSGTLTRRVSNFATALYRYVCYAIGLFFCFRL